MSTTTPSNEDEAAAVESNPLVGRSREHIEAVGRVLPQACIPDPAAFRAACLAENSKPKPTQLRKIPQLNGRLPVPKVEPRPQLHTEPGTCTCCGDPTPLWLKSVPPDLAHGIMIVSSSRLWPAGTCWLGAWFTH
jgi:hypothetical protein